MSKYILTVIVGLILTSNLFANTDYDAEYLEHETHEIFYEQRGKKFNEFIHEVEVHRKIRILSLHGLERYNRLYIPTYEDLDFRSLVFDLSAKTIKKNGQEIILDQSAIKETTLPGNNPYLRNYEGVVKLVALEQVDIGDIIEYSYKVRYIHDYSRNYVDTYERIMQEDIPINSYSRTIKIKEGLHIRLLESNLPSSHILEEGDKATTYSWYFIDLVPIEAEDFMHEYNVLPHISLLISTYKMNLFKSWEAVLRAIDTKPKGRYNFISEFSINDLVGLAKQKQTVEEKVRLICDSLYQWRRDKDEQSAYGKGLLHSNWYSNNKYLSLFKRLGIKSSIIKLRPLSEGPFDEEIITLEQFETSLIEFEDENGVLHYLSPLDAFVNIDHMPFIYQGSRAVRLRELLSDAEMEVFTVPYQSSENRVSKDERTISLAIREDSIVYDLHAKRTISGHPSFIMATCYLNKTDSVKKERAIEVLDESLFNRASIELVNSTWQGEVQDYYTGLVELRVDCQAKEKMHSMQGNLALWELLDIEDFDNWLDDLKGEQDRKFDAHICSAYKASSSIEILASDECNVLMNELMNVDFANEFGSVKCVTKTEDGNVKIDLSIEVIKGFVPNANWNEFVDFDRTLNNLLLLEMPLISKEGKL